MSITLPSLKLDKVSLVTQSTGSICRPQDTAQKIFEQKCSKNLKCLRFSYQLTSLLHLIPFILHQLRSQYHLKGKHHCCACQQLLKSFCTPARVCSIYCLPPCSCFLIHQIFNAPASILFESILLENRRESHHLA